jgi:hypothetical protein
MCDIYEKVVRRSVDDDARRGRGRRSSETCHRAQNTIRRRDFWAKESYGAAATRGEAGNIKESVCDTASGKRVEIANDGRASLVRASIARRVVIAPPPHLPKREKAFFFSSRGSLRRPGRFAPKRVGFFAGAAAAFALPPKPKPFFAGGASASFFFPKPKSAAEPPL